MQFQIEGVAKPPEKKDKSVQAKPIKKKGSKKETSKKLRAGQSKSASVPQHVVLDPYYSVVQPTATWKKKPL